MNASFEDLKNMVMIYNPDEIEIITKAYEYAKQLHDGQFRQSGEPYISHPVNVAYILAEMHADKDTICAGLLHDTLEDTNISKEDIAHEFNIEIANLVYGVTKLGKMNFSSKEEQNLANTRKIITGITDDVRIIVIKLADRLHNMRTLEHKSEFKQKENSLETMDIFVPFAYYIGAYGIKSELDKLLSYTLDKDIIEEEDIIAITSISLTNRIFELVKMITNNKIKEALDIYEDLVALKEPSLKIMILITRQFNQLLQIKELMSAGFNEKEIVSNMKLNPYVIKNLMRQARGFDMALLLSYVKNAIELEEAIKKGNINEKLALELLMLTR